MSNARQFAQRCLFDAVTLIAKEQATRARAELRSQRNPQALSAVIVVTCAEGYVRATFTASIDSVLQEATYKNVSWQLLAAQLVRALPQRLFAEPSITGRVVGWRDHVLVHRAFGDSHSLALVMGSLNVGLSAGLRTSTAAVHNLIQAAANQGVDYVCRAPECSAQICVDAGSAPRVWINVDGIPDSNKGWLYACTNDSDLQIGAPPTFVRRSGDPLEIAEAISAFLSHRFADTSVVTVRLIRRCYPHAEPVLVGTSTDGALLEQ